MKRSTFLKSLGFAIAAPALFGATVITKTEKPKVQLSQSILEKIEIQKSEHLAKFGNLDNFKLWGFETRYNNTKKIGEASFNLISFKEEDFGVKYDVVEDTRWEIKRRFFILLKPL